LSVVDRILRMPELEAAPPVLVDIGAARGMHPPWRSIAEYSVCVAFEADERELGSVTSEAAGFRKLTTFNCIASERASESEPFHLTASPYCSSRLRPRPEELRRYAFAPLFRVERTVDVRARDLPSVLSELGLDRIDWLKIDSQGTDLRLLRSLGDELAGRTLVVELEPGIIDAYDGEDRLEDVLAEMNGRGFWMSDLKVRGSTRIDWDLARRVLGERAGKYLDVTHKTAPGWAEVEYFNSFDDDTQFGRRELLLGYAFAFARRQYAFALQLAAEGHERFGSPFDELRRTALTRVKAGFARLPLSAAGALGLRVLGRL
jgi:FkbM family methyltransferase